MKRALLIVFRGVFLLLAVPLGTLALTECALRGLGVGQSLAGVRTLSPAAETLHAPNPAYYQQFSALPLETILTWDHMDYALPSPKPENEFRIIVLGESAAHGAPFNGYGFYRYLEVMLEAAFPETRFVVVNAACPGVNSHALRPLVKGTRVLDPDLYLIYMGNNETTGTYGPATTLGRYPLLGRLGIVQAHIWLRGLRLTQWLSGSGGGWAHADKNALAFAWDWSEEIEATFVPSFRANLAAMCDAATNAGVPVLLATLAHHLERKPAPTMWNEAIRQVAERYDGAQVVLADVARDFDEASSTQSAGADAWFIDPIHFTPAGNDLLARSLFPAVARLHGVHAPAPELLAREAVEARIGLSAALLQRFARRAESPEHAAHRDAAEIAAIQRGFESALLLREDPRTMREYAYWLMEANLLDESRAMARAWAEAAPYLAGPGMLHARFFLIESRWAEATEKCVEALRLCPDYPGAVGLLDVARSGGEPVAAAMRFPVLTRPRRASSGLNQVPLSAANGTGDIAGAKKPAIFAP
jgi:lysophospholipase L1-like esterase